MYYKDEINQKDDHIFTLVPILKARIGNTITTWFNPYNFEENNLIC